VGRRPGPTGGSGCLSANNRAVSVSSVSAERAVGIAFVILNYLKLKIVGDLKRDQGLILIYTFLPALFCSTIIVQALKRGLTATRAIMARPGTGGSSEQAAWNSWNFHRGGRTRGDHAAGVGEANVSGRVDERADGRGGSSTGRRSVHIGNPG